MVEHPVASEARLTLVPQAPPSSRTNIADIDEPSWTPATVPPSPPSYDGLDDSDVFVCDPNMTTATAIARTAREVTLFIHGWHSVEPGLLSWKFPSLRAALDAVHRMKNAIAWCVVSGTGWRDLDAARAGGAVLVEQLS